MTDHMSARNQRIEVITRGERRRRWSVEEKREIALESLEPDVSVSIVARRHGIGSGQLYTWRRQLLEGSLGPAPLQQIPGGCQVLCVRGPKGSTVESKGTHDARDQDRSSG
jgi:transposase-like protein